jgi:UDP-glucose 4-epimerase
MPNKILITGGAGYIGSHAAKYFLEKGYSIIIFDNFFRGFHQTIDILKQFGQITLYEGDLKNESDLEKIFAQEEIETVLHFAALCLGDESLARPDLYFLNNTFGCQNLLDTMVKHNVKRFILSSTGAVYGQPKEFLVSEDAPKNPSNPYGESKLMVEQMLKWYNRAFDLKSISLRYFNVCGADSEGIIGDSKKPSRHLVQNAVRGAMQLEPFQLTYPPVNTKDGSPVRDYIDVEDLVAAHHIAYEHLLKTKQTDAFNLGTGKGYSVLEIVKTVEEYFKTELSKEKSNTPRQGEDAGYIAKTDKTTQVLNWQPKKDLNASIESLRKWYEKYPNGYER